MERLTGYTHVCGDRNFVLVDHKSVEECGKWQKELKRLASYEDLGVTPEQICEMDRAYLEKCEEVNRLIAELDEVRKHGT